MGEYLEFNVEGLGKIRISTEHGWQCGTVTDGYSFFIDYGDGFMGGVLSKRNAEKMARMILAKST